MSTAVKTTATELGESRVRLDIEVEPDAVEEEVTSAARELGRDLKLPGFRAGKVPPPVVMQRVGREAVLDEAVRRGLPGWYEEAVTDARIVTVGDPKVDLGDMPERGSPLAFSVEVAVRPKATLGDYRGLEVGRRAPEVSPEDVDREIERLRESVAALENVERPAASGDFTVVDFVGRIDGEPFTGGEARGFPLELGSGRLLPGFEDQLVGAAPGEQREVDVTFPDDYGQGQPGAEQLAGREAVFTVDVKEVKEKRLPELGDDFATEAGGFDTLDELRADIESKIAEAQSRVIDGEFREAVVDAVAARAQIELPDELVHAKAHEMWENTARRLQAQGIDPARYLEITGKDEHDLIDEAEPEARRALARESVLAAIVEAEGIEVTDDEVLDTLRAAASASGPEPSDKKLRRSFDKAVKAGRDVPLREDIAMRKAVDLLVEHAKPIPEEQARAREELWTPEKETPAQPAAIWTPGS